MRVRSLPGSWAIIAHIQERAATMFEQVQSSGSAAVAPLFDGVERIAEALDLRARSGLEIERKCLLHALPSPMPEATIRKSSRGTCPGASSARVHGCGWGDAERYYRTVKLGRGPCAPKWRRSARASCSTCWGR
ncbi:MAG: hypothetical protein IPK33_13155 [Gemmatimonadetes bacterium]|nr:hypothetical protein [Gemmatimonadota bacterium]